MTALLGPLLRIALISGLIAGVATSIFQELQVTPLLLEAERLEQTVVHLHDDGTTHVHEGWAPENGWERRLWTGVANVVTGWAFALLLGAAMFLRGKSVDAKSGVLWGLLGFLVFVFAPSLGLPPELPGMEVAELEARQFWWLGTVLATASGLALAFSGKSRWWQLLGASLLLTPHLLGAPHPVTPESAVPAELSARFVMASLSASAGFWVLLGGVSGKLMERLSLEFPETVTAQASL
ncbi:MAG: CbtA family protein [bacterium]